MSDHLTNARAFAARASKAPSAATCVSWLTATCEQIIAHLAAQQTTPDTEARRLQAADERVRALHHPAEIEPSDTICGECSYGLRNGRYLPPVVEYPCPTIAALGVE